jgi:L-alanine-DL-glutamate epimerase-like enolase superfamily enzyme
VKLHWNIIDLWLSKPFVGARGKTVAVRQVFIRLIDGDIVGFGASVIGPTQDYSGDPDLETLEGCRRVLGAAGGLPIDEVMRKLEIPGHCPRAILSAIDMALHDLLGKRAGVPLHAIWDLSGVKLPDTALSIGQPGETDVRIQVAEFAKWPILKIKMTPGSDIELLPRLREIYTGRLWVDANGSWTLEEALKSAEICASAGVELLEQPLAKGSQQLRDLHQRSPVEIVVDEDCSTMEDIIRLAGITGGVNIKVGKFGGLFRAREAIILARKLGLKVMLGCKTESALGVTATSQLGGLADYLDLDGHLDIVDDPFKGLGVDNGHVILPRSPGIGASVRRVVV